MRIVINLGKEDERVVENDTGRAFYGKRQIRLLSTDL